MASLENCAFLTPGVEIKKANLHEASMGAVLGGSVCAQTFVLFGRDDQRFHSTVQLKRFRRYTGRTSKVEAKQGAKGRMKWAQNFTPFGLALEKPRIKPRPSTQDLKQSSRTRLIHRLRQRSRTAVKAGAPLQVAVMVCVPARSASRL